MHDSQTARFFRSYSGLRMSEPKELHLIWLFPFLASRGGEHIRTSSHKMSQILNLKQRDLYTLMHNSHFC
jgi:hypothetical protein